MDDIEGRPKEVVNVYQDKERFFSNNIFRPTTQIIEKKVNGKVKKVPVKKGSTN